MVHWCHFYAWWYVKLICFKDHIWGVLKLAQTNSTEDSIENVARGIHAKYKDLKIDAENYDTNRSLDIWVDFTSATLIWVLESISDRFANSLFSALIDNIVTSVVKNKTASPIGPWILFRHSKTKISHLYNCRVTSSHEVRRFKKLAAVHSAKSDHLHGVAQNGRLL